MWRHLWYYCIFLAQAIKQEAGTSDDFEDSVGKPYLKKFVMDAALEDKLCDLYDIFVDVIMIYFR